MKRCVAKRIATSTTTSIETVSCVIHQIVITINAPGTTWKLRVEDNSSTPLVLIPDVTLAAPTTPVSSVIKFDEPIYMKGGIDVVTTGATPGEVALWFNVE